MAVTAPSLVVVFSGSSGSPAPAVSGAMRYSLAVCQSVQTLATGHRDPSQVKRLVSVVIADVTKSSNHALIVDADGLRGADNETAPSRTVLDRFRPACSAVNAEFQTTDPTTSCFSVVGGNGKNEILGCTTS